MPAIHPNFYALNGTRGYPLDDAATATDDAGRPVPPALLVDCRLRFPATAGRFAFVGALAATPGLVTALFLAAPGPARPVGDPLGPPPVPLAAITVARPVDPGRPYPVDALYPGAGGWVVFGPGIEEPYSGRFSSVTQSQLLARCARAYRPPPIPSLGKEFVADPLTGLVRVLGGADVEVVKDTRRIKGRPTDCLVFRLVDDLNRNVLRTYAGPCSGRPESRTCPRPGLEWVNLVGPDCDGNLVIDFRHVGVAPLAAGGGVTLDLGVGLSQACAGRTYTPDDEGRLAGEGADLCNPDPLAAPRRAGEDPGYDRVEHVELDLGPDPEAAPAAPAPAGLPYAADFAAELPPAWVQPIGTREFVADPAGRCLALADRSRRNVLIWADPGSGGTLGLDCRARLQLRPGTHANGGLVLNYRPGAAGRPEYHLLLANASTNSFELWAYNGTVLSRLTGLALGPPRRLAPGRWYELAARTRAGSAGRVVIEGTLRDPAVPGLAPARLAVAVAGYLPATGKMGLGTDQAYTLFGSFELREAPDA